MFSPMFNMIFGMPDHQRRSQQSQAPQYFLAPDPFFIFFDTEAPQQRQGVRVPRPPYTNRQFKEEEPKPVNLQKQMSQQKKKEHFNPNQGGYWECEGDEAYERKDYIKAIEHYTKAIELSEGTESQFYRSRGNAYKALKQYDEALKDAIQAIELDDKNIKAHLLCGQVLAEKGKLANDTQNIQTAIIRLTKAMTLCAGQKKSYYETQLSKYIYRAKKLLWYKEQEIKNNAKRAAIKNYQVYLDQNSDLTNEQKQESLKIFIESIGDPDQIPQRDIPEYMICRITLDLMQNPVVTESGLTYEKEVLVEHFKKNGGIDPTTRQPISTTFFPNVNIKKATEEFLLKNPWAFEFKSDEDYRDIEF